MSEIMSLNELCQYLKLTKSTLYKLSERGQIPSSRVGRQLRFRKSRIDAWLSKREKQRMKKNDRS